MPSIHFKHVKQMLTTNGQQNRHVYKENKEMSANITVQPNNPE